MATYILIVVTMVQASTAISQQEYFSQESCEAAKIQVIEMVKRERGLNWNIQIRCVAK